MVISETLAFYLISSTSSVLVVILGVVYKSKCRVITCCGCMRVERDVNAEERIDEMELGKSTCKKGSEKTTIHIKTQGESSSHPQILYHPQPTTQPPKPHVLQTSSFEEV
jgi:hypothetical protein